MMRNIIFIILSLFCSIDVKSAEILFDEPVSAALYLNTKAMPGDIIVLRSGTFRDAVISFHAKGAATNPIIFKAEKRGSCIFTGDSRLSFSGAYIKVDGFTWENGGKKLGNRSVVELKTSSDKLANYSTLQHCKIDDFNLDDLTTDNKWISVFGFADTIRNCMLTNKRNLGATLTVWLKEGEEARHLIEYNYFLNRMNGPNADNGLESLRIGDSKTSMTNAYCKIQYNRFESCDGEIEIISNKSCHNQYLGNQFVNNDGGLTLRHGNNCIVEGNYFFGADKPLSYGVRIIGEGHTIRLNYMEGLKGAMKHSFRAPINVMAGVPNSPLNGYFQVKNALIEKNFIINSEGPAIRFGAGKKEAVLPPVKINVQENHVHQLQGKNNDLTEFILMDADVKFYQNKYSGAKRSEKGWEKEQSDDQAKKNQFISQMKISGYPFLEIESFGPKK